MRGHFVGKLVLNHLVDVKVADIELDGVPEKCVIIPIKRNDIIMWNDELQYWFRAFAYRSPLGYFTHFMMKFIPRKAIKRLSATQIESFASHSIGNIRRIDNKIEDEVENSGEILTEDFIQQNI